MQRDHTIQPAATFDTGPTIQDIDQELRAESDAMLNHYAKALDTAQIQAKPWEAMPIVQRRALRAGNELARRQHEKEVADKRKADDARAEAQHTALVEAKIATYKAQIRGVWVGDQASFDAAWPAMLQQWQIDQARATMDASTAAVRQRLSGF